MRLAARVNRIVILAIILSGKCNRRRMKVKARRNYVSVGFIDVIDMDLAAKKVYVYVGLQSWLQIETSFVLFCWT